MEVGSLCTHRPAAAPGTTMGDEANLVDDDGLPVVLRIGRQAAKGVKGLTTISRRHCKHGRLHKYASVRPVFQFLCDNAAWSPTRLRHPSAHRQRRRGHTAAARSHFRTSATISKGKGSNNSSLLPSQQQPPPPWSGNLRDSYAAGLASFSMSETVTMASIGSGGGGGANLLTGPPSQAGVGSVSSEHRRCVSN